MKPITFFAASIASFVLLSALPAQALAAPPSAGPLSISIDSPSIREGNSGLKTMTFKVTLSARSASVVTVAYQSIDSTATSPADYLAVSGILTFAPGERTKTIAVQIVGDTIPEANEQFVVGLSNPTGGAVLANLGGVGTIRNDDH